MNLPNILTIIRIFMLFPIVILIEVNAFLSGILFILAIFTDYLDGKIARRYNKISDLGKFLDPSCRQDSCFRNIGLFCMVKVLLSLDCHINPF